MYLSFFSFAKNCQRCLNIRLCRELTFYFIVPLCCMFVFHVINVSSRLYSFYFFGVDLIFSPCFYFYFFLLLSYFPPLLHFKKIILKAFFFPPSATLWAPIHFGQEHFHCDLVQYIFQFSLLFLL